MAVAPPARPALPRAAGAAVCPPRARLLLAALLLPAALAGCDDLDTLAGPEAPSLTPARATTVGSHRAAGGRPIPGQYVVVFRRDVSDAPGLARRVVDEHRGQLIFSYASAIKGFAAMLPPEAVEALRRNPNVQAVEQDAVVGADEVQPSPTWGLDRIDQRGLPLDRGYGYAFTGEGVTAYILDTGIRFDHADFEGRAVRGTDVINDGQDGNDCRGHGTHVAGTVGGRSWGVAKRATLVSVRVLDCNGAGTVSGAIAGLDWVTRNRRLPAVANVSLGAAQNESLNAAVRGLIAAGVQVAVAAGNSGADACTISPASTAEAVTVGAAGTEHINDRQTFSNWGSCVDLFAPGSLIVSASHLDAASSAVKSGTSMAAPHAAGVMALWLHENPALTPAQLQQLLVGSATQNVVLDARSPNAHMLHSVRTTGAPTGPPPPPPATPPTAAFSARCAGLACTVDASASTGGSAGVARYDWSFGDGTAGVGVTATRSYAAAGSYAIRLTVTNDAGATTSASQTVAVTSPPPTADFAVACAGTDCRFTDASGAARPIRAWRWSFGDGATATAQHPAHRYAAAGSYSVRLEVVDDVGASAATARTVTVTAAPTGIRLNASPYKVKRQHAVDLAWSGAAGSEVTVYRNGAALRTAANTGAVTDYPGTSGRMEYRYKVCEAGGVACSAEVIAQLR